MALNHRSRFEIQHWIELMEEKFPVSNWRIGEIEIWPLIRVEVLLFLYSNNLKSTVASKVNLHHYHSRKKKFQLLFKFIPTIIRFATSLKKSDFVFFSYSKAGILNNGHYIDRFCEPIARQLGKNSLICQIKHGSKYDPISKRGYQDLESLFFLLEVIAVKFKLSSSNVSMQGWAEFVDEFHEFCGEEVEILKLNRLQTKARIISLQAAVLAFLLKRSKIKLAFQVCYFSNFAVSLASRKANVKLVEIQHGIIGKVNAHYVGWKRKPLEDFNLRPSHFWCWDKNDADQMKLDNIKAFAGGNPIASLEPSAELEFPFEDQTCILYTLQNRSEVLPVFLEETINATNYKWLIRFHPAHFGKEEEVKSLFGEIANSPKLDFEIANKLTLLELLDQVSLHITAYSTATVEAAMMGVRTILIHPEAKFLFGDSSYSSLLTMYSEDQNLDELILNDLQKTREKTIGSSLIQYDELMAEL